MFGKNKTRKDGLQTNCKSCHKTYRQQHYTNNKIKYIEKAKNWKKEFLHWWNTYKSKFSCTLCQESHISCIQFHHIDDNKENNVAYFVSCGNKEKILEEIDKCIPLCANCHFKEHYKLRHSSNSRKADFQSENAGAVPT